MGGMTSVFSSKTAAALDTTTTSSPSASAGEFMEVSLLDALFKYLRKEYEDESVQFFENMEKLESMSPPKIETMVRYIFKRVVVCDCNDVVLQLFLRRTQHLNREKRVLQEIHGLQKYVSVLYLLRYFQFYTISKSMEKDSWLVDETALIPLDPGCYNSMEKCLASQCKIHPTAHAFTAKGWARGFIDTMLALPLAVSVADARTFENPGFPLIYVNKHFEMLTGYSREYCLGKNCKFLQFFPTTRQKTLKLRSKPTTSSANISSLDDPDIEHPDGKINFLIAKDYEKMRAFFPSEEFYQDAVEEDQTYVVEQMSEALKAGNPFVCIVQNYRSDGSKYLCLLCLRPLFDSDGKYAFVVGLHYDVTKLVDPDASDEPIDWDSRPVSPNKGTAIDPQGGRVAGISGNNKLKEHLVHDHHDRGLKINNDDGEDTPPTTPRMGSAASGSGLGATVINMTTGLLFNKTLSARNKASEDAVSKAREAQDQVLTRSGKAKLLSGSGEEEATQFLVDSRETYQSKASTTSKAQQQQQQPGGVVNFVDLPADSGIDRTSGDILPPLPSASGPNSGTSSPAKSIRGRRVDYTHPGSLLKFIYLVLMFSKIFPRMIPRVAVGQILQQLHDIVTDREDMLVTDFNEKNQVIGTAASAAVATAAAASKHQLTR